MNKFRNEFEITLNGKTYLLRASFEALAKIEQATNVGLPRMAQMFQQGDTRAAWLFQIVKHASVENVNEDELKDNIVSEGLMDATLALNGFFAVAVYGVPDSEKKQ